MNAHHPCPAAVICAANGHELDPGEDIGRCRACGQWVLTRTAYEQARRHGHAGPNRDGTYWALIPDRLGGGMARHAVMEDWR